MSQPLRQSEETSETIRKYSRCNQSIPLERLSGEGSTDSQAILRSFVRLVRLSCPFIDVYLHVAWQITGERHDQDLHWHSRHVSRSRCRTARQSSRSPYFERRLRSGTRWFSTRPGKWRFQSGARRRQTCAETDQTIEETWLLQDSRHSTLRQQTRSLACLSKVGHQVASG